MGLLDFITGGDKKGGAGANQKGQSQNTNQNNSGYQSVLPSMQGNIPFVGTNQQPGSEPVNVYQPGSDQNSFAQPQQQPSQIANEIQPMDPMPNYQPQATSDPNAMESELNTMDLNNGNQLSDLPNDSFNPLSDQSTAISPNQDISELNQPESPTGLESQPQQELPATNDFSNKLESANTLNTSDLSLDNTQNNLTSGDVSTLNTTELNTDNDQGNIASEVDDSPTQAPEPNISNEISPIEPTQSQIPNFNFDPSKIDLSNLNLPVDESTPASSEPTQAAEQPVAENSNSALQAEVGTEPTLDLTNPTPEIDLTSDLNTDSIVNFVEAAPSVVSNNFYNKVAILSTNGAANDSLDKEGLKVAINSLLKNGAELTVDSESGVTSTISDLASANGKKISEITLKINQDEVVNGEMTNKYIHSDYLYWAKNIIKNAKLFLVLDNPSVQNHAMLLNLITATKLYSDSEKRIILFGVNWASKVQQMIELGLFTQDDITHVSVCANSEEILRKLEELNTSNNLASAPIVKDMRKQEDISDYL